MKKIGLTGPSGAGKGIVCEVFAKLGFPCADTDRIYHELLVPPSKCLDEIVSEFGSSVLKSDGTLNRATLAKIVFSGEGHKDRQEKLNKISHKYVLNTVREWITECEVSGFDAVVVDAPLLFESGFDKECDLIIVVISDIEIRIARIMKRDSLSVDDAYARINSQPNDEYYIERADYIVTNNGTAEEIESNVHNFIEKFIKENQT